MPKQTTKLKLKKMNTFINRDRKVEPITENDKYILDTIERIKNESIFRMQSIDQDRSKEIRYSKNIEFTEKILIQFENQKLDMDTFLFNNNLLIRPFFL